MLRRVRRIAVRWLFVSLSVLAPRAGSAQATARVAATAGLAAYENGDYELALTRFAAAEAHEPELDTDERVVLHKFAGYCLVALGRRDEGKAEFKLALALAPELKLDEGSVSPKIVEVFNEARAELPAATASGSLIVAVDVVGAEIRLDGQVVGAAPLQQPITGLAPGDHALAVSRPGFDPLLRTVTIVAGETARVEADLSAVPHRPPSTLVTSVRRHPAAWSAGGLTAAVIVAGAAIATASAGGGGGTRTGEDRTTIHLGGVP
jgi:hypothetical protein